MDASGHVINKCAQNLKIYACFWHKSGHIFADMLKSSVCNLENHFYRQEQKSTLDALNDQKCK